MDNKDLGRLPPSASPCHSAKPEPQEGLGPDGRVSASAEDDPYWEYDEEECANCGGEGFTYGCSWDWQCDTWDGDSCLCTRRCDWCNPAKPNAELQQVLADALAQGIEARRAKTGTGLVHESAVANGDAPNSSPQSPDQSPSPESNHA
jgi:hypothetical protein